MNKIYKNILLILFVPSVCQVSAQKQWQSKYVNIQKNGKLKYIPDQKGNVIPDFSRVGYHQGNKAIPEVKVAATLYATGDNDQQKIQAAIDELAKRREDGNGIRGAILLKKGIYKIPESLKIGASGIVLRGEGEETKLIATGKGQKKTIVASGMGKPTEIAGSRIKITDKYVPVGATSFSIASAKDLKPGDQVMVYRPGTPNWIHDLKMDEIEAREGTVQWKAAAYGLEFERKIVAINGNRIEIDNPIVMALDGQYGGGEIYKYEFNGRIAEVGIENLLLESEYENDTDEDHGWEAISFNKIENAWVKGVISKNFGFSCVNLGSLSKQVTVTACRSLSPKSQITGGRRYSFNNDGQLNLFTNCYASEGRHDYVTGAKTAGPNVFYNCSSENAKADIGPHQRWAVGTLYDNIITDGEINVQDRGNWGTGHGWAGVNQILWNCRASKVVVQSPYVSGVNYAIGVMATKYDGRLGGRPDGEWEGNMQKGLNPPSLYLKQWQDRKK